MTEDAVREIYERWEALIPQMPQEFLEFCEEQGIDINVPEDAVGWFLCFSRGYLTGTKDAERLIDDIRSSCESEGGQKSLLDLLRSS